MNGYIKKAAIAAAIAGIFLFFILLGLTSKSFHSMLDYSSTGQIGDTIGGITAPFIGVSAAILTFLAFFMQFKANEKHNRQFNEQSLEKEREKHENKILYLIKQNRNIAENMSISDRVKGAKCFSRMFNEYRAAYEIVESFYSDEIDKGEIDNYEVINISFIIFYNGTGNVSNELNMNILKNTPRINELLAVFDNVSSYLGEQPNSHQRLKKKFNIKYNDESLGKLSFKPFDGHTTRLGQYFRNLFHILSYTQDIDTKLIPEKEKYELIKSLRSQLSSYEQILIYFNSLSLYGAPLRDSGFINQYHLIKNIPIPLVKFAGDIHDSYDEIGFEWDQIVMRAEKR